MSNLVCTPPHPVAFPFYHSGNYGDHEALKGVVETIHLSYLSGSATRLCENDTRWGCHKHSAAFAAAAIEAAARTDFRCELKTDDEVMAPTAPPTPTAPIAAPTAPTAPPAADYSVHSDAMLITAEARVKKLREDYLVAKSAWVSAQKELTVIRKKRDARGTPRANKCRLCGALKRGHICTALSKPGVDAPKSTASMAAKPVSLAPVKQSHLFVEDID